MNLASFDTRTQQNCRALLLLGVRSGIRDVGRLITLIDENLQRLEENRQKVEPLVFCPSCADGILSTQVADSITIQLCVKKTGAPGCGWSRMI